METMVIGGAVHGTVRWIDGDPAVAAVVKPAGDAQSILTAAASAAADLDDIEIVRIAPTIYLAVWAGYEGDPAQDYARVEALNQLEA